MEYFVHESSGSLDFIANDGYWAFLMCDDGIVDYYAWLAKKSGVLLNKSSSRGAHITFIRGEQKVSENLWGKHKGDLTFNYAHILRTDNDRHAWLDVYCPRLHEIREELGLPKKAKISFHLTIGRLL